MTSEERREARYQRRKAKRQANRQARSDAVGPLEKAFSYRAMFLCGRKCCNGVRWKQSTQNFELHLFSGTAKRRRQLLNGAWKQGPTVHFTLRERGKIRPIDAPHINDRQIHKTLTKRVLVPLYSPSMIYDNGASQKGKGLHFHYKRLAEQLRWHYRRYGLEGAMDLLDYHQFFPTAPHAEIYGRHREFILDPSVRWVADAVLAAVPGGVGMPLGVEPSQQEMVALPSALDNYLKCQRSLHVMGHYMDDYEMAHPTMEQALEVMEDTIQRAEAMGLQVNRKKCKTVPISKPFRFCKAKFQLTGTGKVIIHGSRDGAKRARKKLRHFKKRMDAGTMTPEKAKAKAAEVLQAHVAYYENYNDHGRVLRLRRLYYALFIKGQNSGGNHV